MIVNRKNIIAAALKVNQMDRDTLLAAILKLLETNPTIVLRTLEVGVAPKLYKVVVADLNGENRKINAIKCFREISGLGLADSKAWSEGQTVTDHSGTYFPSGVFAMNLSHESAKEIMQKVVNNGLSWKVAIVDNDAIVPPLPHTWTGVWA